MTDDGDAHPTEPEVVALRYVAGALCLLVLVVGAVVAIGLVTVGRARPLPEAARPLATLELASTFDDFNRADGDLGRPVKGAPWDVFGPSWSIEGGEARLAEARSGAPSLALTSAGAASGVVQVTLPAVGNGSGIVFRFRDLSNYWQLVAAPQFGTFVLSKVVAGSVTVVGDVGLVGVHDGVRIGVALDGAEIDVLVDGLERASFTDIQLQDAEVVGLIGMADDELRARFDDFVVSAR